MTNREMMEIAMRQSAEDMGCHVEDFKADKNVVVPINLGKKARKYLKEPITCNLVSYGNNIMAASIPETMDLVSAYVDKFELNKIAARWPAKAVVQFLISFLKKQ